MQRHDSYLASEIHDSDLISLLEHPEVARKKIPELVSTLRGYIQTEQTCSQPESARAWQIVTKVLADQQGYISAADAIVLAFGSFVYDAPNQKDIDLLIYTDKIERPTYMKDSFTRAINDAASRLGIPVDYKFLSLDQWREYVINPKALQDPVYTGSVYYATAQIVTILYGLDVSGKDSTLQRFRKKVETVSNEVSFLPPVMASALTYMLHNIQKRKGL